MLHYDYQCHRLIGSGEDFESILTIFGHEGRDWPVISTICSLSLMKFGYNCPSGFCGSRWSKSS